MFFITPTSFSDCSKHISQAQKIKVSIEQFFCSFFPHNFTLTRHKWKPRFIHMLVHATEKYWKNWSMREKSSNLVKSQMLLLDMQMMVVMVVMSRGEEIWWTWLACQQLRHELNVGNCEPKGLDAWQSLFIGECRDFSSQFVESYGIEKLHKFEKFARSMVVSLPSFKLNIRRRSLMLAARRWAIDATRRRVFLVFCEVDGLDDELDGVSAVLGDESRCETKLLTWLRGQIAEIFSELSSEWLEVFTFFSPKSWNPIMSL